MAWAVGLMAIAPVVNTVTPFLNDSYNSHWTPDILYRLNMYWHGGLFLPWVIVLLAVIYSRVGLDRLGGFLGKLLRVFLFGFGILAAPLAGIGGMFNVTDKFAFGIPHLLEYPAFAVLDLISITLIISLLLYPRFSGRGYKSMGIPYYVLLLCVIGAFIAAMLGYVAAYITVSGPSPPIFAHYINSTMYPVLGYYNSTSVVTFAQDAVTSHSHAMLPIIMAGIVVLVAMSYGHSRWSRAEKAASTTGFLIMAGAIFGTLWVYLASGVGNYTIPTLFASGPNGIAEDDIITGLVGAGALFVLAALLSFSRRTRTEGGTILARDPLFLSTIASWVLIYLVIPVNGFYIELHESYYGAAGAAFDAAYTRFHQDFAFFALPALVTTVLVLELYNMPSRARKIVGYLYLSGQVLAYVAGETYSIFTLNPVALALAVFGGAVMMAGVVVGLRYIRKAGPAATLDRAELTSP